MVRKLVERCFVVAARAVVARDTVDWFFVSRGAMFVRETTAVFEFVPLRDIVLSSRTAALAMPTLTIYAITKIHALFILLMI